MAKNKVIDGDGKPVQCLPRSLTRQRGFAFQTEAGLRSGLYQVTVPSPVAVAAVAQNSGTTARSPTRSKDPAGHEADVLLEQHPL